MKLNNNDDSHNSGLNLLIYNMLLDIESHPAWVCGLKQAASVISLYSMMSHPAWVCGLKHVNIIVNPISRGHTLRGCVDWNLLLLTNHYILLSHTLRGCVDWNISSPHESKNSIRHTLRGCVDWNRFIWVKSYSPASHTLRGCVDWNILGRWLERRWKESHPAWVCGLKHPYM